MSFRNVLLIPALVLVVSGTDALAADTAVGPRFGYNFKADAALVGLEWDVMWDSAAMGIYNSYEGLIQRGNGPVFETDFGLKFRVPAHDIARPTIAGGPSLVVLKGFDIDDAFDGGGHIQFGLDVFTEKIIPFLHLRTTLVRGPTAQFSMMMGLRIP